MKPMSNIGTKTSSDTVIFSVFQMCCTVQYHICLPESFLSPAITDYRTRVPTATVDYITDEENVMPRAGAITIGGLAGLIIGARRRGGLVKKVLYTSTGVASK